MNTISKIHQLFSELLNNSRILECPEEFLGENYEAILNFWMILDELSEEELKVVEERYEAFFNENRSEWYKARYLAIVTSEEVVGWRYSNEAGWAACDVAKSWATCWATRELI